MRHHLLAGLVALMVLPTPMASAQGLQPAESSEEFNIAGEWSFEADTGEGCSFTGSAVLFGTPDENVFECELTALQICADETWQVRQSCTATRQGDILEISSEIEEFIQGYQNGGYLPDNFRLAIQSPDLMQGYLMSWGFHIAEFRRAIGAIS